MEIAVTAEWWSVSTATHSLDSNCDTSHTRMVPSSLPEYRRLPKRAKHRTPFVCPVYRARNSPVATLKDTIVKSSLPHHTRLTGVAVNSASERAVVAPSSSSAASVAMRSNFGPPSTKAVAGVLAAAVALTPELRRRTCLAVEAPLCLRCRLSGRYMIAVPITMTFTPPACCFMRRVNCLHQNGARAVEFSIPPSDTRHSTARHVPRMGIKDKGVAIIGARPHFMTVRTHQRPRLHVARLGNDEIG